MASKSKTSKARGAQSQSPTHDATQKERVAFALQWLEENSTPHDQENLARFGIDARQALGVSMANIQRLAKLLGKDHALAEALWDTECYEARLLTSFVGEAEKLTPRQMDTWCLQFDNWAVCDTLCFHLFDRTPHAWSRVAAWRSLDAEFPKRAAFALLASIAGHDGSAKDEQFIEGLAFIEAAAADERNFVKKGVDWALRRLGSRNLALNRLALATAQRLADRPEAAARWIGRSSLRELASDKARARFAGPSPAAGRGKKVKTATTPAKPTAKRRTATTSSSMERKRNASARKQMLTTKKVRATRAPK